MFLRPAHKATPPALAFSPDRVTACDNAYLNDQFVPWLLALRAEDYRPNAFRPRVTLGCAFSADLAMSSIQPLFKL